MSRRGMIVLLAIVGVLLAGLAVFLLTDTGEPPAKVSLVPTDGESSPLEDGEAPLRIAVSAMTSPKETFVYYREILDYIGAKMGRTVELVQRTSYEEINDLLESQELDLAFVCTGAYVEGRAKFGMEIVCGPEVYGEPVYYSYIIVPETSDVRTLQDLRGTSYAFTDPMSNTGRLVPLYMLGQIGETPESFFSSVRYTYSHDKSIEAVSAGIVDGASVDSLIYDYMVSTSAPGVEGARVAVKSPPYGIPPVVVHPDLDREMKDEFRTILLEMHEDPAGARILSDLRIDRFVVLDDSAYDSVREMQAWLDADPTTEE